MDHNANPPSWLNVGSSYKKPTRSIETTTSRPIPSNEASVVQLTESDSDEQPLSSSSPPLVIKKSKKDKTDKKKKRKHQSDSDDDRHKRREKHKKHRDDGNDEEDNRKRRSKKKRSRREEEEEEVDREGRRRKDKDRDREKKKKKKKDKKRKRHDRYDSYSSDSNDEGDDWKERQKVYDFEKKRIRLDPRASSHSMPHATSGKTLWWTSDHAPVELTTNYRNFDDDQIFRFDLKGDPNNLLFDCIYREYVPLYRLYNSENPYWSEALKWKRLLSGKNERKSKASALDRYWRGSILRKLRPSKPVIDPSLIRASKKHDTVLASDYIPIEDSNDSELNEGAYIHVDSEPEYDEMNEGRGAKEITMDDSKNQNVEQFLFYKTKQFNEHLQAHPHNVGKWIDFVRFQDEYLRIQSKRNTTAISEKKIAIYEKAIQSNPSSSVLLSGYMRENAKIYPYDMILKLWIKVLTDNLSDINLWNEFILFKKSSFTNFTIPDMRTVYREAIRAFIEAKKHVTSNDQSDNDKIEECLIKIFFDMCIFEKQSGYTERSIAMCQALIEMNCFCPIVYTSWDSQITGFQDFWESEAPRFGETGATGWNDWLLEKLTSESSDQLNDKPSYYSYDDVFNIESEIKEEEYDNAMFFIQWMKEEDKKSNNQLLPCRSDMNPSEIVSCPDRVVLFEDIVEVLFPVLSDSIQKQLIFLILELLGFPIYYMQRSIDDIFTHENMSNKNDSKHLFSIFSTSLEDRFDSWKPYAYSKRKDMLIFLRSVLEQSTKLYPDDNLLKMALLDFLSQSDIEAAKKTAKMLLSNDRQNLILWNQYAQLERKSKNFIGARDVYENALQIMDEKTPSGIRFVMYRCYSDLEILNGDMDRALHALCVAVCVDEKFAPFSQRASSSVILRARQLYRLRYDEVMRLYSQDKTHFENHLEFLMCYCLFEYIASNGYLETSNRIFESVLYELKWSTLSSYHYSFSADARAEVYRFNRNDITNEDLHQLGEAPEQYLWLLYLRFLSVIVPHCGQKQLLQQRAAKVANLDHIFSKKVLKNALGKFLSRFPAHPVGLSIYIENEQKAQLSANMRRFLDHKCQLAPSPINFMFTIYAELRRGGTESVNRIRSLFERGLEYQTCRTNSMFWRMYLHFEHSTGELDKAKKVFYRAIDKCCYAKFLWLDAPKIFKDHLTVLEYEELVELMDEKQILLRNSFDDVTST